MVMVMIVLLFHEDHKGTVSTGDRTVTNFRFADDTNGLAGEEEELAKYS